MCTNKECLNPVPTGCGNWTPPVELNDEEFNKNLAIMKSMYLNPDSIKWDKKEECPFCEVACTSPYDQLYWALCEDLDRMIDCPICGSDYDRECR